MSNPNSETAKLISGHGGTSTPGRSGSVTPRSPSEVTRVSTPKSSQGSIGDEKGFEDVLREKLASRTLTLNKSILLTKGEMPKQGTVTSASRKEHSEQGRVKRSVYIEYTRAASVWGFVLFFFSVLGYQASSIAGTYSLRAWGNVDSTLLFFALF
jgi:hypothetical protein